MAYIRDQSHGNYRHYYVRRRANEQYPLPLDRDERLALFPHDMFKGKIILDVGCNSGEVAVELAQRYEALQVVGVDIDNALVVQCKATVEHAFSLQRPLPLLPDVSTDGDLRNSETPVEADSEQPSLKKRKLNTGIPQDRADDSQRPSISANAGYFPSFFPSLFGTIDIRAAKLQVGPSRQINDTQLLQTQPNQSSEGKKKRIRTTVEGDGNSDQRSVERQPAPAFPRNLVFYAADWPKTQIEPDADGYDIILGFSLTKWIHLHDLDEGLVRFFRKCYDTLHQGGVLILEKQGWKGYKQAKRMSDVLKRNYQLLRLRPETDFDRILLETVGFSKKETVRSTETEKGFDRDVEMYWKL